MTSNTTGEGNTAVGTLAANKLIGNENTVLGQSAIEKVTEDKYNTAIGVAAGYDLSKGEGNIYLGYAAGPTISIEQSNQLYIHNITN